MESLLATYFPLHIITLPTADMKILTSAALRGNGDHSTQYVDRTHQTESSYLCHVVTEKTADTSVFLFAFFFYFVQVCPERIPSPCSSLRPVNSLLQNRALAIENMHCFLRPFCRSVTQSMPRYQQPPPSGTRSPRSSPACYQQ